VGGRAAAREAPLSRWALVALAALAAAALAGAIAWLLPLSSDAGAAPARPLALAPSFSPGAASFGDTVAARVVVTMDTRAVRPSSLKVVFGVAPLTQLGRVAERHATRGALSVATYELRAACLSEACVAASGRRNVAPPPVRAHVARRAGGDVTATAGWVPLTVSGRVAPGDLARARPPFRADATPPPPTYRVAPRTAAVALDVVAAFLAACAAGLAATAVVRARRPRDEVAEDELVRALQLARSARSRPEPDRRTAVGHLGRLLADRDEPLAVRADDLAWSRPAPSADALTELVEGVERERPA
jgi:hypothetical protein